MFEIGLVLVKNSFDGKNVVFCANVQHKLTAQRRKRGEKKRESTNWSKMILIKVPGSNGMRN